MSELARDALRPIIRPDMRGNSPTQEQIGQEQEHILRANPSGHHRGQILARVLVENVENSKRPAIVRPICHTVIRPHMVGPLRPLANTRAVGQPEARPLRLRLRPLEAFLPPNRIHAILSHVPALVSQEIRHRLVAVPPVLLGQCDDPLAQPRSFVIRPRYVPIGAPDLAHRPTRSTLGHLEHCDGVLHRFAPAGRA